MQRVTRDVFYFADVENSLPREGRAGGGVVRSFSLVTQRQSDFLKNILEHFRRQHARVRIIARAMIAVVKMKLSRFMHGAVTKWHG